MTESLKYGFSPSWKREYYKENSLFNSELSLILKLHDIYSTYGLKLTYKIKHGELYHNNTCIYRAGCITSLSRILNNSYEIYNDAHNRLFNKIEELSPMIIKVPVRTKGPKRLST